MQNSSDANYDGNAELEAYAQFDRRAEDEANVDGDYSPEEIRTNRFWNVFFTLAALGVVWIMFAVQSLPFGGAVALSVMILIFSWLYRWLFASNTAAKLDENSAGSGKRVGPVTMGTILGYLNDGFKW